MVIATRHLRAAERERVGDLRHLRHHAGEPDAQTRSTTSAVQVGRLFESVTSYSTLSGGSFSLLCLAGILFVNLAGAARGSQELFEGRIHCFHSGNGLRRSLGSAGDRAI